MKSSIKDQFKAIYRAYRVAHRTPILADGAIESRIHATSVMRAFTGKWDTCQPYGSAFAICPSVRTSTGKSVRRWPVWRACTQWLKANR